MLRKYFSFVLLEKVIYFSTIALISVCFVFKLNASNNWQIFSINEIWSESNEIRWKLWNSIIIFKRMMIYIFKNVMENTFCLKQIDVIFVLYVRSYNLLSAYLYALVSYQNEMDETFPSCTIFLTNYGFTSSCFRAVIFSKLCCQFSIYMPLCWIVCKKFCFNCRFQQSFEMNIPS